MDWTQVVDRTGGLNALKWEFCHDPFVLNVWAMAFIVPAVPPETASKLKKFFLVAIFDTKVAQK